MSVAVVVGGLEGHVVFRATVRGQSVGVVVLWWDAMMSLGLMGDALNRLPVDQDSGFTKACKWQGS